MTSRDLFNMLNSANVNVVIYPAKHDIRSMNIIFYILICDFLTGEGFIYSLNEDKGRISFLIGVH